MTRAELKSAVRDNLGDDYEFFSDAEIEDSTTDAYYFTAIFANAVEKTVDISFTLNNPYYDLLSIVPDLFAVTAVYHIVRREFLVYKSRRELQAMRADYEVWPGPPQYFTVLDQSRLGIFPQSSNAVSVDQSSSKDLKIFYRAFDDSVHFDAGAYRIPPAFDECLEFYVTADLLEQIQEWSKADAFWKKYYNSLGMEKVVIRNRPMSALVNALAAVSL